MVIPFSRGETRGSGRVTSPNLEKLLSGRAGNQIQDFLKTYAMCPNDFFFLSEKRSEPGKIPRGFGANWETYKVNRFASDMKFST